MSTIKKKISEEKEESLETLLPFQENKIIVKKVSKTEYSYGLKNKKMLYLFNWFL